MRSRHPLKYASSFSLNHGTLSFLGRARHARHFFCRSKTLSTFCDSKCVSNARRCSTRACHFRIPRCMILADALSLSYFNRRATRACRLTSRSTLRTRIRRTIFSAAHLRANSAISLRRGCLRVRKRMCLRLCSSAFRSRCLQKRMLRS